MPRFFITTGPCDANKHYMVPANRRLPALRALIEQELYFVMHAPRQVGKTTTMLAFAAELRKRGTVALYASLETARGIEEVERAEPLWIQAIADAALDELPPERRPPDTADALSKPPGGRFTAFLAAWSREQQTPIVLLLDEVDTLAGEAMVSFLSQLRGGFTRRPRAFPASVGLIGMRDLRDYVIRSKGGVALNPGSPFNIKAESVTLRNFNAAEVGELYAQHTGDTGQEFTPDAVARAFDWTRGQPFLVNALARIAVMTLKPDGAPITADDIDLAKDTLIRSRTTHLDNLAQRLREDRVASIVQSVLLGEGGIDVGSDDLRYCFDLGLLSQGPEGIEAANPIYREVLIREITASMESDAPQVTWPWLTPAGKLDFPALIAAFLEWWREHGDLLVSRAGAPWLEAAAHLAFLGFLQKVVNGGGRILREYASGRGRLDVRVDFADERFVVELKRVPPRHVSLSSVTNKGVQQLAGYLDQQGCTEGWLLIFDQRPGLSWDERLWQEDRVVGGKTLHLRGG